MSYIINKENALGLLSDVIDSTRILSDPKGLLIHSESVGDRAGEVALKTLHHYPDLHIDVNAISCAGYLHDIGRPLSTTPLKQIGHEIRSSIWIIKNGHNKGISVSKDKVNKIARMVKSHSSIFEQWALDPQLRDEFVNDVIDPITLYPRTFGEACITYSDLVVYNGGKVDASWKINDAIKRYDGNLLTSTNIVGNSLIIAKSRLLNLVDMVECASQGKLSMEQLEQINF